VIETAIWPLGTVVGRDGHVRVRTHDLAALAERYGTPLYVYDAETIRASLREYVDAFFRYRPVKVAYSLKACALIGVGGVIAREGIDASVASLGELMAARRAGFPASRMELHGNANPDDEVAGAFYLVWWTARRDFDERELALLETATHQVGLLLAADDLLDVPDRSGERRQLVGGGVVPGLLALLEQGEGVVRPGMEGVGDVDLPGGAEQPGESVVAAPESTGHR